MSGHCARRRETHPCRGQQIIYSQGLRWCNHGMPCGHGSIHGATPAPQPECSCCRPPVTKCQKVLRVPYGCAAVRKWPLFGGRGLVRTSTPTAEPGRFGLGTVVGFKMPYRPSRDELVARNARFYRKIAPLGPCHQGGILGCGGYTFCHVASGATPSRCGHTLCYRWRGGTG